MTDGGGPHAGSSVLDRWMPAFHVNEVHDIDLRAPPDQALERAMALPAAPDWIVRSLFRIRGVPGGYLRLDRFTTEVLGLAEVERTPTTSAAVGTIRRIRVGVSFAALPVGAGTRVITETRVQAKDRSTLIAFRAYWLVVGPFSAIIRRRWLRALRRDLSPMP